jgi:antitoxin VapB
MASLYVKKDEAGALASELAELTGRSKTEAVCEALREAIMRHKAELRRRDAPKSSVEWLRAYRKEHPLPVATGLKADKAFFDELWGEPE